MVQRGILKNFSAGSASAFQSELAGKCPPVHLYDGYHRHRTAHLQNSPHVYSASLSCETMVLVLTFGAYSLTLSHFSAWLSGPFQISSALSERHQQFSAELPGDLEHIGDGKQGGISKGSGHGAGMGKGPQSETVQQPSIQNTFSAMATYVSIAVLFAWLEVMFEKMLFLVQGAKVLRRN